VDETVLRRPVGGAEAIRDQLRHLVRQAALPSVCLQVMPVSVGTHQGMNGAFTVLGFADPDEPEIAYTAAAATAPTKLTASRSLGCQVGSRCGTPRTPPGSPWCSPAPSGGPSSPASGPASSAEPDAGPASAPGGPMAPWPGSSSAPRARATSLSPNSHCEPA
jgi:hypothetical protein